MCILWQRCGLRPSVLGQDRSETKQIGLGLGLAVLVLDCERPSCHARRHNDLEAHNNFSSTIYGFSILCLEHHYCGDQQWRLLTQKLIRQVPLFTSGDLGLGLVTLVLVLRIWSCLHHWLWHRLKWILPFDKHYSLEQLLENQRL